jgi:hypothetical protein
VVKSIRRAWPGHRFAQPAASSKTATAAVGNLIPAGAAARLAASSDRPGLCAMSSAVWSRPGSSWMSKRRVSGLAAYARGSNRTDGGPPSSAAISSQVCWVRRAAEQITTSGR